MTDILGPADAPNFTTDRPADDRTIGATDTWSKDCTGPNTNDGTKLRAALVNSILANLRTLVRGNGNTGTGPAVVAEDNADDMIVRAVRHLIQRGQPRFGIDSGAVNALAVSLTPALAEYKAGVKLLIMAANTNTGMATLNVNGLGAKSIVRRDGTALVAGDIIAGALQDYVYDGTNFQMPGAVGRPQLLAPTTLYVDGSAGSDTLYDGSAASVSGSRGPFKTIGKAISIAFAYGQSTYTVTIQVADGTYSEAVETPTIGGPEIVINGNATTPSNVVIDTTTGYCVLVRGPNSVTVSNLKGNCHDVVNAAFAAVGSGASMKTINTVNGNCAQYIFLAAGGGSLSIGSHNFAGNGTFPLAAYRNGSIILAGGAVYTISAPISVTSFAFATECGALEVGSTGVPTFVNPGNVTGKKYQAQLNGAINSQGQGTSYFPGSAAGTTATGGQYA